MKIAYVMSRFPLLSETFILREMIEVEKRGHEVALYPLIYQKQDVVHNDAKPWMDRIHRIPFISISIAVENIRVFLKFPAKYISLVWKIIRGNRSSLNFLVRGLYLFPKAVYTAKIMKLDGVQHIHAHYATHPALEAWIIHKLTGISYSITIHSHDIYDCHAMLGPKLLDALFLAPISQYNIKYLENLLGNWVEEKCHVVHCGIDPARYTPSPKTKVSPNNLIQILQVGTLHWKKGQVYLVQAMALLKERGFSFQLKIIGEGEERQNIENEIRKYNLSEYIELLGAKKQDEVAGFLQSADCYIQSSTSEGIPVAIMEAMACELPVVATNITGIPELVKNGETGILVEPMDPAGITNALQILIENPAKRREMGKAGRIRVLDEFTLAGNIDKLVSLFEKNFQN